MTLAIPAELHKLIRKHDEIKWSEVARKAMWEHAKRLEIMDKMLRNSKLTQEEVMKISDKIKQEIARKHRQ